VGLKPSRGRNSFGPALGERWAGFSAEGFVTRSVRDTAALLDVTAGPESGDPYVAPAPERPYADEVGLDPGRLRIGLMARAPRQGELHADCREAVQRTGRLLEDLGHHVEESHPEALDAPQAVAHYVGIVAASVARALDAWSLKIGREIGEADVEPLTWAMAQAGRGRSAADYLADVEFQHAHARRLAAWWEQGFDLLLTPSCGAPPPRLGSFDAPPDQPLAGYMRAATYGTFTLHFNMSGQPAISLPLHWNQEGLPVGSHLVAPYGREDLLIRIASQLERAEPWAGRLPPLHASR
jgi:amidase